MFGRVAEIKVKFIAWNGEIRSSQRRIHLSLGWFSRNTQPHNQIETFYSSAISSAKVLRAISTLSIIIFFFNVYLWIDEVIIW